VHVLLRQAGQVPEPEAMRYLVLVEAPGALAALVPCLL
jgi:hypothetical protein